MIDMTIEVQGQKELNAKLQKILEKMRNPKRVLSRLALEVFRWTQKQFQTEGSLEGGWKKSQRAIEQSGMTLRDTGMLMNSFSFRVEGNSAIVGTPVKYSRFHQFGTTKMVARPMLPSNASIIEKQLLEIAEQMLKEEINGTD